MANAIITDVIANEIANAEVGVRPSLRDVRVGDTLTLVGVGTYKGRDDEDHTQIHLRINDSAKVVKLGIKGFANMKIFQGEVSKINHLRYNTELRDSEVVIVKDILNDDATKALLEQEEIRFKCLHTVIVTNFLSEVENEPKLSPRYYKGYKEFQKARNAAMEDDNQARLNAAWDTLYMSGIKDGININDPKLQDTTPIFMIE